MIDVTAKSGYAVNVISGMGSNGFFRSVIRVMVELLSGPRQTPCMCSYIFPDHLGLLECTMFHVLLAIPAVGSIMKYFRYYLVEKSKMVRRS